MLPRLRHLGRLYRVFLRNCLVREMEFRANFFASLSTIVGWLLYYILLIDLIYRNTESIAGWSKGEALVLSGSFTIIWALLNGLFYDNLSELPLMIERGTFDLVLTKPVGSQFFLSTRRITLSELARVLGSVVVVIYGAHMAGLHPAPGILLLYLLMLACGLVILYSIYALLMTLSFWFVRLQNLDVVLWSAASIARYPLDIFSRIPRTILTFVIPLAFLSTVPARALRGVLTGELALAGVVFAFLLFTASRLFWRFALRFYSSAGG
ncbi:MAG TPA: ABC-2 family transporter protein [Armatimonadota bacterium]|nr:ABC-2 family transporter protein [Armatimonadota bacterium]